MATTSPPKARPGLPPAAAAQLVLGAVVLAHLTIVELAFLTAGTGKNAVLTVAKFFGLHAASLMMVQLLLIARLPLAGPPPRHGPAHPLAPLGRLHTVLDGADPRHAHRARLRPARRRAGARDVPGAGRGGRLAARHARRDDHRRRSPRPPRGSCAGGCPTRPGTPCTWPSTSRSSSPSCTRRSRAPRSPARGRRPTGGRCGRWWSARWSSAGWSSRCAATPGTASASPASSRKSPERHLGVRHGPRPRHGCPPARASSSSGASPTTTAGGRPTRSRSRRRRTAVAAAHRQGRRHDQRGAARPPGRQPGVRRGPVRRVHPHAPDHRRACC